MNAYLEYDRHNSEALIVKHAYSQSGVMALNQVIPMPEPSESLPPLVCVSMKQQTSITVQLPNVVFESVPAKSQSPIKIVDNKIRVDEHQMEDDMPYAFRYLGKIHLLTRTSGKLTLCELE